MIEVGRVHRDDALLLVIDMQEKFRPVIPDMDETARNAAILIRGFRELRLPVIVTEQYPKGLGATIPEIADALGEFTPMEKMAFSLFRDDAIHRAIDAAKRKHLVLLGVEAHVCVIQTLLDARAHGYSAHLAADAVSSRNPKNVSIALRRAEQSGAYISSAEMILFQLLETAEDPSFRTISAIVK